jgi:hypothetical protein
MIRTSRLAGYGATAGLPLTSWVCIFSEDAACKPVSKIAGEIGIAVVVVA